MRMFSPRVSSSLHPLAQSIIDSGARICAVQLAHDFVLPSGSVLKSPEFGIGRGLRGLVIGNIGREPGGQRIDL